MTNADLAILLNEFNETVTDIEEFVLLVTGQVSNKETGYIKTCKNKIKLLSTTLDQLYDELNDGISEILNEENYSNNIKKYWVEENTKILNKKIQCKSYMKAIRFLLKSYDETKNG